MRRCAEGCRRSGRYTARRAGRGTRRPRPAPRRAPPPRRRPGRLRGGAVAEQAQTIGSAVQTCVFVCRALELGRASVDGAVLAGGDARGAALAGGLFSEGRCCPARGTTTRAAGLELDLLRAGAASKHALGMLKASTRPLQASLARRRAPGRAERLLRPGQRRAGVRRRPRPPPPPGAPPPGAPAGPPSPARPRARAPGARPCRARGSGPSPV